MLREAGLTLDHVEAVADQFGEGAGYRTYELQKRRGGTRTIFEALVEVSSILRLVREALEESGIYNAPACVHGYVRGRSIVTNAAQHLNRDVVLGLDLRDFFPSITTTMVEDSLSALRMDDRGSQAIARASTIDGVLAQGLSTSPFMSNIVFRETDADLVSLANEAGVTYSRFADDLIFSDSFADEFADRVREVLDVKGWVVNEAKTRFMRRGSRQYVTGLYVGMSDRPRVPRRVVRSLRQRLYYLEKYGFSDVNDRYPDQAMFQNEIEGWIRYIGQTDARVAKKYKGTLENIDFDDEYLYWDDPNNRMALFEELGL